MDKVFICIINSLAGALVLFAKKKGGLWFYVDPQGLKNITQKNRYPLPLIKEILSSILKTKYFTKLDIIINGIL